ncbi:MAG: PDZ domain-containing protein [Anaerolineae bacterium]|nr:PDZ domain-containing protein [Anaerolineae bacterium]MCB0255343.1 PDZ domain-containing protein [Anaerolineae bacterium]
MRHKRLFIVLAVLAMVSLVGVSAAFAANNASQTTQQAAADEFGLVIVSVDPAGPAATAGVMRGDILFSIGGEATNNAADVTQAVAGLAAGDDVEVVVTHGDEERTLTVTVGDNNGRAYLGIQPYYGGQTRTAPQMGTVPPAATTVAGAAIVDVVADSPAEAAGLQTGDVILSVNGDPLSASNTLADAVAAMEPGDSATLEVQRSGEDANLTLDVTLGENPDNAGVAYLGVHFNQRSGSRMNRMPFNDQDMPSMPNMPFSDRGAMPFENVESGVIVLSVTADSPAEAAGLAEGDVIVAVNGDAVETPEDVVAIVGDSKPGDQVTLSVQKQDSDVADEVQVTLGERPDDAARAFLGVSLGTFASSHVESMTPGQGQFQMPFEQDNGSAPTDQGQPQSPLDLLQQLFPGMSSQQNS